MKHMMGDKAMFVPCKQVVSHEPESHFADLIILDVSHRDGVQESLRTVDIKP